MTKPLDPYSMVVDERRRWDPEWYGWITDLESRASGLEGRVTSLESRVTVLEGKVDLLRIPLTANQTFWVSDSTGSDSNPGTLLSPWKTPQFAYNTICGTYDFKGFNVTIKILDGTFSVGLLLGTPWTGGGRITIDGTAGSVAFDLTAAGPTGGHCFYCDMTSPGVLTISNIKVKTTIAGGAGIYHNGRGTIALVSMEYGACANGSHVVAAQPGGVLQMQTGQLISGGAQSSLNSLGGVIQLFNQTVRLNNLPNFSVAYVNCSGPAAKIESFGVTFQDQSSHQRLATTGTSSGGSAVITAIPSTANLTVGMAVIGTNIPVGAKILTIDSGTQITMTVNATGANAGLAFEIATGSKYNIVFQGGVTTFGSGADYFPGSIAGFANAAQFALYL